jgi:hypothetical protein
MDEWDFTRLPKTEHAAVIQALNVSDVRALLTIHDKYQLSPHQYCCDQDGLKTWFLWAVQNGIINGQGTD